jgi:ribulose-5-phosphate 4-epimerase/fuculose-1-phosphate aldolase
VADAHDLEGARRALAIACRVMAHRGLVQDVLGHISMRWGADRVLVRSRGPQEAGLRFTTANDIRLVSLQDPPSPAAELDGGYRVPNELPIHTALLADRPDVHCVVHVHPTDVVIAALAELPLVPFFGAYDIAAMRLAERGIPTYPRSVLIGTPELAREMMAAMGDRDVVILAGHGLVTTGTSIASAMVKALQVDRLARLTLAAHAVGVVPQAISAADRAELPDLGGAFNEELLWRYCTTVLDADGWGL